MRAAQAMADLFALQRIHGDVLFRNDDYVAAEKAKAIGRLLEHLRRELRELALPLVDAWNIPVRVISFKQACDSIGISNGHHFGRRHDNRLLGRCDGSGKAYVDSCACPGCGGEAVVCRAGGGAGWHGGALCARRTTSCARPSACRRTACSRMRATCARAAGTAEERRRRAARIIYK